MKRSWWVVLGLGSAVAHGCAGADDDDSAGAGGSGAGARATGGTHTGGGALEGGAAGSVDPGTGGTDASAGGGGVGGSVDAGTNGGGGGDAAAGHGGSEAVGGIGGSAGDASAPDGGVSGAAGGGGDKSNAGGGGDKSNAGGGGGAGGTSSAGSGGAVGICAPGATRCALDAVETCTATGEWGTGVACPSSCRAGACVTPPSCVGIPNCGVRNESCCSSPRVRGGSFLRSYDGVSVGFTDTSFPASVSDFRLDRFEVNVARFRGFVLAWRNGWRPQVGSGKHSHLNGGKGLAQFDETTTSTHESGWDPSWQPGVTLSEDDLQCRTTSTVTNPSGTWRLTPSPNDNEAITCVNWYEAQAFCTWDGGFLPSETEWNYAAAGGNEQRVYAWSSPPSSTTIDCSYAGTAGPGTGFPICPYPPPVTGGVGVRSPKGDGKFGQADLTGAVWEWAYDSYASYVTPCVDCAFVVPTRGQSFRGGSHANPDSMNVVSYRGFGSRESRGHNLGFRCARVPQ